MHGSFSSSDSKNVNSEAARKQKTCEQLDSDSCSQLWVSKSLAGTLHLMFCWAECLNCGWNFLEEP